VRRAALLLATLGGACAATPIPTRDELALALGSRAPDAPTDITHIACRPGEAVPTEYVCRWRQREDRAWDDWEGRLASGTGGWHLLEPATRRP
jgi:hypothetical protein